MRALYFIADKNGMGVSPMYSKKSELIKKHGKPGKDEAVITIKEGDPNFNFCWPYRNA